MTLLRLNLKLYLMTDYEVIDGFQVPDNPDDIREWYAMAADQVAMLDGDSHDKASRNAHVELAAARKAMEQAGLAHGGPRAERVGIEDARGRLGDLVDAATDGADIVLTRRGRAVARVIPVDETAELVAPLSEPTLTAIAHLVERTIEAEYDPSGNRGAITGARMRATLAVQADSVQAWIDRNSSDRGLPQYSQMVIRVLVASGLKERECGCTVVTPGRRDGHDHIGRCTRHTEADVPELDGRRYCGTCYVAIGRHDPTEARP